MSVHISTTVLADMMNAVRALPVFEAWLALYDMPTLPVVAIFVAGRDEEDAREYAALTSPGYTVYSVTRREDLWVEADDAQPGA